jgi:glycosyltransferase involved in cell wall biosynthesis
MSEHPAVATSFITRELARLRALDFDIHVASINLPARRLDSMPIDEREEVSRTFYVKPEGIIGVLFAHVSLLFKAPWQYLRGLFFALGLGKRDPGRMAYSFFYFSEALLIGQWMRSLNLTHLHVHFANAAATVGLIVSQVFDTSLSLTVHGSDEFYDVNGHLLKEKIAGASFICCIGQYTRSQLMRVSSSSEWDKFEVVPCGIDTRVFRPRDFRLNPSPFEILCVARLVAGKGHTILLAALRQLLQEGRKARLRLVGDGPERHQIEREVARLGLADHVIFEGAVNQDRIGDFYSCADTFVLASFAEGIPIVLMEAMAMEIPCVSTFVGGIPELIRNDIDGILVVPSDYQGLAAALERLISEPDLRRRLGTAGRRRVVDKYNLDRNAEHLGRIFSSHLNLPATGLEYTRRCPEELRRPAQANVD